MSQNQQKSNRELTEENKNLLLEIKALKDSSMSDQESIKELSKTCRDQAAQIEKLEKEQDKENKMHYEVGVRVPNTLQEQFIRMFSVQVEEILLEKRNMQTLRQEIRDLWNTIPEVEQKVIAKNIRQLTERMKGYAEAAAQEFFGISVNAFQ